MYGYGNPGRQDDGLGNELVKLLQEWTISERISHVSFDSNYQLNIEDAEAVAAHDLVIFADASTEEIEDCLITRVTGERDVSFTSHAASPGYVVKLAGELFDRHPGVFLLHIRGYEWEFREGLSEAAVRNLQRAVDLMKQIILDPEKLNALIDQ